jgi:transcriptional/translational regulatory protein YebC/TACO1
VLGAVLADARAANVPNDVIKRNMDKAASADAADFKESIFEFYGPGGCGMIVNILSDNGNRAANDINLSKFHSSFLFISFIFLQNSQ